MIGPDRYVVRHPVAVVTIAGRRVVFACGHRAHALEADSGIATGRLESLAVGEVVAAEGAFGAPPAACAEAESLLAALHAVGALAPA